MEAVSLRVINTAHYGAKVFKAVFTSPVYLKVRMSAPRAKVYGIDFQHAIDGISYGYDPGNAMGFVLHRMAVSGQRLETTHGWECSPVSEEVSTFPHYFCLASGEIETDIKVDVEYFAPAPETGAEFYGRLMPFLHGAAKACVYQSLLGIEKLTGNARDLHVTTRHSASNERAASTANGFRLPIGYAARELDRHTKGAAELSRADTEQLVFNIHDVFSQPDAWWSHHSQHDVAYWKKYHDARVVLFSKPDGSIEHLYDIDANIKKNLPKADRDNQNLIKRQGETEFSELATRWFTQALYTEHRAFISQRPLTLKEKT